MCGNIPSNVSTSRLKDEVSVICLSLTFYKELFEFVLHHQMNDQTIFSYATAFSLDVENKQYLITASHVIKFIGNEGTIDIFHDSQWKPIDINVVGRGDANHSATDVAVLAATCHLDPSHPGTYYQLKTTTTSFVFGQQVYFCGFPYDLYTEIEKNNGYPVPMIKGALISGTIKKTGMPELFVLDGHNNPGFSGGPVAFQPEGGQTPEFQVIGVVSGYHVNHAPVIYQDRSTGQQQATKLVSRENAGIILCPSIKQAIDMIERKPIGFELPLIR